MSGANSNFLPSQLELLEFFGVVPVEESPEDGYWCWEVEDVSGVRLRFSLNELQKSVQTVVTVGERTVVLVSHENAGRMWLTNESGSPELVACFDGGSERTEMRVSVSGKVSCV